MQHFILVFTVLCILFSRKSVGPDQLEEESSSYSHSAGESLFLVNALSIGYSMFCVGYGIYTSPLPSVYFITNTKYCIYYLALTQLFLLLVSHLEMYTLCSILLQFVQWSLISVLAMDAFTWDKWILLAAFFVRFFFIIIWEASL